MSLLIATLFQAGLQAGAMAAAPPPVTVIHAGRLLDRPGSPPRGNATIVVDKGRIVSVATASPRRRPARG